MNRVLLKQLDTYLRLNTDKVSSVFDKFGISVEISPSPYSVVEAYRHFREPFAVELFNALYPEMVENMEKPKFSNAVGPDPAEHTDSPETVNRTSFWDGFSSVLNGLTQLAPAVQDTIYTIKNGQKVPVEPQVRPPYLGDEPKQGIDNNILIYIGLGFLAIVVAILIFKKTK